MNSARFVRSLNQVTSRSKKTKIASHLGPLVKTVLELGAEKGAVSSSAFMILDSIASTFSPAQVLPPIFEQLQSLSGSPTSRKSGVTALGVVVDGCASALHPHMEHIWPFLEMTLRDADVEVRRAALVTLSQLAQLLGDNCSKQHALLMPVSLCWAG